MQVFVSCHFAPYKEFHLLHFGGIKEKCQKGDVQLHCKDVCMLDTLRVLDNGKLHGVYNHGVGVLYNLIFTLST